MEIPELNKEEKEYIALVMQDRALSIQKRIEGLTEDYKTAKEIFNKLDFELNYDKYTQGISGSQSKPTFPLTSEYAEVVIASLSSSRYRLEKADPSVEKDITLLDIDTLLNQLKQWKNENRVDG